VIELLIKKGGIVSYHDPYVPELHFEDRVMNCEPLNPDSLGIYDAVVILADHSEFDPQAIVDGARLVIDTRNFARGINSERLVRL
jgi:UDP-N-acetyl-D-glucosamine dehydrogenase